jgi:hypothetical protein
MAKDVRYKIRRTPWKVEVEDRLLRVEEDVRRAISVKGWSLDEAHTISRAEGKRRTEEMNEAQAVVTAVFEYTDKARQCLQPPGNAWRRLREWLAGELLMSAYTSLHAAESNRVLLLSSTQLAALLPVIRQRATTFLPANDPRLEALNGVPDPTAPAHQALARVQGALLKSVIAAQAPAQAALPPPPADEDATPDAAQATDADAAAGADAGQADAGQGDAGQGDAGQADAAGVASSPPPALPPSAPPAPSESDSVAPLTRLSEMLGPYQQIAAMAMNEACRTEDLQQSEVRRFRNVLLGTFGGLFIVVAIMAILGSVHPTYFPLCLQSSQKSGTLICPTGSNKPSAADILLIMGLGVVGGALAVARNLAGLKTAGVRYSLSVAQGLIKIAFGAITAVLGIIILSTQSSVGFLASQAGLLTTAVIFGYSQQLFTKLIDQQADDLVSKASG